MSNEKCPTRNTPELPSPTSCLPEEETEELEEKIDKANQLLLSLALSESDDVTKQQTMMKLLDGIVGLRVRVLMQAEEETTVEGKLKLVGYDFALLEDDGVEKIVPFTFMKTVEACGRFAEMDHEPSLEDIDECFRELLVNQFGCVVSGSPELINLFFRIRLDIYLLLVEAKRIRVYTESDEFRDGLLTDVNKGSIVTQDKGKTEVFNLDHILMIDLLQ
ncbi:hypothetical protein H0266_14395 [Halobacillus locisalis]|uniref:Uncharacterized protein n=1 Tax=Halobacillus locisalis TaxID=220753 RepID=A0A838CVY8_9BACI|nr:hypothetical protein [Halobacillus locisalis]MBA2176083.1 hypothetical protein [Halobacillus locisalis]